MSKRVGSPFNILSDGGGGTGIKTKIVRVPVATELVTGYCLTSNGFINTGKTCLNTVDIVEKLSFST